MAGRRAQLDRRDDQVVEICVADRQARQSRDVQAARAYRAAHFERAFLPDAGRLRDVRIEQHVGRSAVDQKRVRFAADLHDARDARAVIEQRYRLRARSDQPPRDERREQRGVDRAADFHRRRLHDRIEVVFAVGRDGVKRHRHAADVVPVRQIHVRRPVAVKIFRAQRQAALGIDPDRFGFATLGVDLDVPRAPVADRTEGQKARAIGRSQKFSGIDEVRRQRAPAQHAGEFLHVAVARRPDAIADAQRRFHARTEALVVAFAIAVAPAVKDAAQSFARNRAGGFDRRNVAAVRGSLIRRENVGHRRRIADIACFGNGHARKRDQRRGEENALTVASGTGRANRGRF